MGSRTYSSDERHLDPHEVRSPLGGSLTYSGRDKFVDTDMEHILHKFSTSMTGDILTGRIVYPRSKAKRRDKKAMDRDPLKTKRTNRGLVHWAGPLGASGLLVQTAQK